MYIPDAFRLEDQEAIRRVLDRYAFAALVTSTDAVPEATHLPFIYEPGAGPRGRLVGHLARANGQDRQLAAGEQAGREVLAIFQGPHAYVSPRDYGAGPPTVPTWNYIAVHVYGVPRLFTDRAEARALVTALTARHEAGRTDPWSPDGLDPDWVEVAGRPRSGLGRQDAARDSGLRDRHHPHRRKGQAQPEPPGGPGGPGRRCAAGRR